MATGDGWSAYLAHSDFVRNQTSTDFVSVDHDPSESYELRVEQGLFKIRMPWIEIVEAFIVFIEFLKSISSSKIVFGGVRSISCFIFAVFAVFAVFNLLLFQVGIVGIEIDLTANVAGKDCRPGTDRDRLNSQRHGIESSRSALSFPATLAVKSISIYKW